MYSKKLVGTIDCLLTVVGGADPFTVTMQLSLIPFIRLLFTARRSYASGVLGVVILSVCPSVTRDIFMPHERAILLVKCDFSYSCAADDKISTDLRRRAVPLR